MNRTRQLLPWGLVLLLLAWASPGVWPVVPVEGDEQGVLFGVDGMLQHDAVRLNMRYIYYLQPGYYQLLAVLVRLTGLSTEILFGITTVIGAAGFALAGARLLQILTGWALGWTLVAMLWCQEVTTAAFYMNTSALAGAGAILAVILSRQPQRSAWLWAGVLLTLAGWLRADSLLVAPACLGIAYWREKQWQPALIRTAVIAVISLAGFLGLYALSGASLGDSFAVYQQRGFLHSGWRTFVEVFPQLLSPALALAGLAGLGLLLSPPRRALGLVFITGVAASFLAHGTELTTPKYFYYITPFLLVPALALIDWLMRAAPAWPRSLRRAAGLAAVSLLVVDSVLGLRTLTPVQRYFLPAPTIATLGEIKWKDKIFALVIGPGELIPNVDAFRLRTGQWFAPACWHREKQRMQTDLATLRSWLTGGSDMTLFCSGWLTAQVATRELLAAGFRPLDYQRRVSGVPGPEEWWRAEQVVHLGYLGYVSSIYQPPGPAPASTTGSNTYFIGDGANQSLTELADDLHWHLHSALPEGLVTLYQRR